MNFVYSNYGVSKKSIIIDSKVIPRAAFSEVRLTYKTNFENGEQYEQFVWYVDDGRAGLFSYGITRPKGITNP